MPHPTSVLFHVPVFSQYNLGCLALEGSGVPQDYGRAVELFTRSAEQGMRAAECSLGVMYASGWGVERDYGRALELFERSAAQGHAEAQVCVKARSSHWPFVSSPRVPY